MERSHVPLPYQEEKNEKFRFSEEEDDILRSVMATLSPKQLRAARLEAAGMDANVIAASVKCHPQTITVWRSCPSYNKARNLFISIINRHGIEFRLDCQKQIIAPAYAELIRRMSEPRILKSLAHKEILDTIKTIGKESRLDMTIGGASEDDGELRELQERRKAFSFASQAEAVNKLTQEDKIIAFPTGTNGN